VARWWLNLATRTASTTLSQEAFLRKKSTMHYTAIRLLALSAALITLTLMIYMAQPWGDNYAYQSLSGYGWLLVLAVWANLPYLLVVLLARKASQARAIKIADIIGTVIISLGVLLYVDAAFLHRDPQGGLVFIAVPFYQWLILGLLAGIHFLFRNPPSS